MNIWKFIFFLLCGLSFFFGFLTYYNQIPEFPPWLWIFVPDCPLYVGLLMLVVIFGIKNPLFRFVAGAGLIKYGLWTLMIFGLFPERYFSPLYINTTSILIVGHLLMILAAWVIVPKKLGTGYLMLALGWFLLNDILDYWGGTKPVFPGGKDGTVMAASIGLSFVSVFVIYLSRGIGRSPAFRAMRSALGVKDENQV